MKWKCPNPLCGSKMNVITASTHGARFLLHLRCTSHKCALNLKQLGRSKAHAVHKMRQNNSRLNRELVEHQERKAAAQEAAKSGPQIDTPPEP